MKEREKPERKTRSEKGNVYEYIHIIFFFF